MKDNPFAKPNATARKLDKHEARRLLESAERKSKMIVRKRDRGCRFPLCGCDRFRLRLEVSHGTHKGMGGNPSGDRSTAPGMVQLCAHRHQDGAISIHKGTLRPRFLSAWGFDGPIAWQVDMNRLREDYGAHPQDWVEVARETRVGQWVYTPEHRVWLEVLAEMKV